MPTREQMRKALQESVVPRLRELGFTGSFPDLRRRCPGAIDLLSFQFDRHGGGFIVELGQCDPEGFMAGTEEHVPADKVAPYHLPVAQRTRVQPRRGSGPDAWFRYDHAGTPEEFKVVAESVLPLLENAVKALDDGERATPTNPRLWAALKGLIGRK